MAGRPNRRSFGNVETRRSKTSKKVVGYRARYVGPDSQQHPRQFGDQAAAEAWFVDERKLIDRDEWTPPKLRGVVVVRLTLSD